MALPVELERKLIFKFCSGSCANFSEGRVENAVMCAVLEQFLCGRTLLMQSHELKYIMMRRV